MAVSTMAIAAETEYSSQECEEKQRLLNLRLQQLRLTKEQQQQSIVVFLQKQLQKLPVHVLKSDTNLLQLVNELCCVHQLSTYVRVLREVQLGTRDLEKAVRHLESGVNEGAMQAAIMQYRKVMDNTKGLEDMGPPPDQLVQAENDTVDRIQACQESLQELIYSQLQSLLGEQSWPPSLADCTFSGFSTASAAIIQQLLGLLSYITRVQLICEEQMFEELVEEGEGEETEADMNGPPLWAVTELCRPIEEKMQAHFQPGRPTFDIGAPEWMLNTAVDLIKKLLPEVMVLEGFIANSHLQLHYDLRQEFIRGMRGIVSNILTSVYLPMMNESEGSAQMWLHMIDEIIQFEREIGDIAGASGVVREGLAWLSESCLQAVIENADWRASWIRAETDDLIQLVDSAMNDNKAWNIAHKSSDEVGGGGGSRDLIEYECTHQILDAIRNITADRVIWLPSLQLRLDFLNQVVGGGLSRFSQRCSRKVHTAETYKDLLGAKWLPEVCAVINACHTMETRLDEVGSFADASFLAIHSSEVESTSSRPCSEQIEELKTGWRNWCSKIASAISMSLYKATAVYRTNLHIFEGLGRLDAPPSAATPSLMQAIQDLEQHLQNCGGLLDKYAHQALWKEVAQLATRLMYNEIATEAQFSWNGARQFQIDCDALMNVFSAYTSRPHAYFREICDAVKLLVMGVEDAKELLQNISSGAKSSSAGMLRGVGVQYLNRDQAELVLSQRIL